MQSIGTKIRVQRRQLGLTLAELAGRTGISTPYLSLIETGRVPNPPSDEKLRQLEQSLGFDSGDLLTQAHLQRTPMDVRAVLGQLLTNEKPAAKSSKKSPDEDPNAISFKGALRELTQTNSAQTQRVVTTAVPVINCLKNNAPGDFSDLSYPTRAAEDFIGCPQLNDPAAFATRVYGDSMTPKYNDGDIVIFSPALTPRNGDDCFIRFADAKTTFMRVFFEPEQRQPMVRLQPRNERYRATVMRSNEITGMYRAAFRFERVDGEE